MTEKEAKEKWCPMARMPVWVWRESEGKALSANRGDCDESACLCYASGCMMWEAWDNTVRCESCKMVYYRTDQGKKEFKCECGCEKYEDELGDCGLKREVSD